MMKPRCWPANAPKREGQTNKPTTNHGLEIKGTGDVEMKGSTKATRTEKLTEHIHMRSTLKKDKARDIAAG